MTHDLRTLIKEDDVGNKNRDRLAAMTQKRNKQSEDKDPLKGVMAKFPKALKKIGVDVTSNLERLGTGTKGSAYDVGNGRALKITTDPEEVQASASLKGKQVPGIAQIFEVLKLSDTGYFAILQEKLSPLDASEKAELDAAVTSTHLANAVEYTQSDGENSWDEVKEAIKSTLATEIKEKYESFKSPEAQKAVAEFNKHWTVLTKKFKIQNFFETLKKLGISYHDYHSGNMLKNAKGEYVVIDLGYSKVSGEGKYDTVTEAYKVLKKRAERFMILDVKILFLDFDGVLNDYSSMSFDAASIDTEKVKKLSRLFAECPDVRVVITSMWRTMYTLSMLKDILNLKGFDDKLIVGATRTFGDRRSEIHDFINANCCALNITAYASLDDMLSGEEWMITPLTHEGLNDSHVDQLIAYFKSVSSVPVSYWT